MGTNPAIPFHLHGLDHVVLRVFDLKKSLDFYVGVLGGSIERRQDEIGLLQLRMGRSLIDLVPLDGVLGRKGGKGPGTECRNVDHFALRIEPYDEGAIKDYLVSRGVAIGETGRRYGAEGEGPSVYIADPDGNVVELKGPPDGAA